jgi:hypothetical protein
MQTHTRKQHQKPTKQTNKTHTRKENTLYFKKGLTENQNVTAPA